ncbi:MAG: shikimate dehydrogenase [Streptosporangiales bacterium]|nr:shikimate dehydrogenase [Streptosporangiales bacterium]
MRAAVLGSPIAHSLSPVLHRAAYATLGLDWTYEAIECDEERLAKFLDSLDRSWAGLSLTMPLKRAVLPLLDEVSGAATAVGGANTVVFREGRRVGHNTDVGGMVDALRDGGVRGVGSAAVLGAGATACSTLAALRDLGLTGVDVLARNPSRARDLLAAADRLGVSVRLHPWDTLTELLPTELLVSTVPSGAADGVAPVVAGRTRPCETLFDVVYDPWPTKLATAAQAAGCRVVGGLSLLVRQAARQAELMTGLVPAPVEAMRDAGEEALRRRSPHRP